MSYPWRSIREWLEEEEKLGNVVRIKKPIKCGDYDNIVDIGNDVPGKQPETWIRATNRYLHTLPNKPIGIIEKPINNRPDILVILNPWPTRERVIRGCGVKTKDELCHKFEEVQSVRIKPKIVGKKAAPCKEVIIREDEIDLRKNLPWNWVEFNQMCWPLCNGTIIVYDPKYKTHDIGKCRIGCYQWQNANPETPYPEEKQKRYMYATLVYGGVQASRAGCYYAENYRKFNKPMPAAYMAGVPTDYHIVAAMRRTYRWPETGDEYEALGGFRGEPVELVPAETIPGMMVPAQAEWIIEGEFLPEDERMPEYAEDIAAGYLFGTELCPIFRVTCITHRQNPIWMDTTHSSTGLNGHEGVHTGLIMINCEVDAINFLRGLGFKVKDVVILDGGRNVAVVQLAVDGPNKPMAHYGKQVLLALHGNPGVSVGPGTKYLIAVGPDIDPYDFKDVMWALGTRTMPVSDSVFIEKGLTMWGDPGGWPDELGFKAYGEQIRIDATIKVPERYSHYPPRTDPADWEQAAIQRIKKLLEGKTKKA